MALWQVTSGLWDVPGNWQGAIPDGSGAIATFDSILEPHAGGTSALVTIPNGFSGGSVTLGRLEIISTAAGGTFFIRGSGVNTADVTLVMSSGSSEPASIFVDTNDNPNGAAIENGISGFKLLLSLASNTNITTQNSNTKFEIASDISGGGEISK